MLILLPLASCAPPVQNGEEGNITILLPGGSGGRFAISQEDRDHNLVYIMDFSGPGGERRRVETSMGEANVTLFLALGSWAVRAEAYHEGKLFGTGEALFTVHRSPNNSVIISMSPLTGNGFLGDSDTEDFGPNPVVDKMFRVDSAEAWGQALGEINSPGNYVITLTGDFSVGGLPSGDRSFGFASGITVSLRGAHTLSLDSGSTGSLLRVANSQTLILRGLTLQGINPNSAPVVVVEGSSASLRMKAGAKITGNTTSDCGGVYVHEGAFTMEGGVISGNTAVTDGGGVVIEGGTFTMSGGVISGNTAGGGGYGGGGGVVVVSGSTFTMEGGVISGNNGSDAGGGVGVGSGSTFTMEGGVISGNTANQGGGVVVFDSSTFTMGGGEISGNTATSEGGGVYFTDGFGGGFTKTGGGTVYGDDAAGYDANGVPLKNTATQGDTYGHAVYVDSGSKYRDITALPGDNIDTTDHGTGLFAAMTGINAEDFGNFALIPKPITVDNNGNGAGSWNAALTAISGGGNDKNYVVNLTGGFSLNGLSSTDWSFGSASGVTVSLRGGGHTLSTGSHGSLLRVNDNQTLILRSLTMTGTTTNSASVVHVEGSSASLFMKDGATISGNTTSGGGGVAVNGGAFTMDGGEISGNTATGIYGGGVIVYGGAFTMDGGEISGNTAGNMGGGVYVLDSSFTMGGGEIHGNTANYGGGVFVEGGSFNKTGGGIIYGDDDNDPDNGNADDNTATSAASGSGHAVYYVAGSSYPYTYYYRDTTLTATDNISTANTGSGWGQ